MTPNLERSSRQELCDLARQAGLTVDPAMSKLELIKALTPFLPSFSLPCPLGSGVANSLRSQVAPRGKIIDTDKPRHHQRTEWHLPSGYGDNKIVLLVRDPYWLFAYWEITPERRRQAEAELQQAGEAILRVYDVTGVSFDGTNANSFFDLSLNVTADSWYIHVGKPNRTYCVDIGLRSTDGRFFTLARSNQVTTPRDQVSEITDTQWMTIEEIYHYFAGRPTGDSLEIIKALGKRLAWEAGFSGAITSITSPGRAEAKPRPFWLVLNTELIVYGATEPDATLTVQGKPVQLRPDGSFSLRFALPDGEQIIPVTAHSAHDHQQITITPIVRKETQG